MNNDNSIIIDAQYLVESYTRQQSRDKNGRIIADALRGAHLLVIIDPTSKTKYRVKYGGKVAPTTTLIPGYAIPLLLNYDIPLVQVNDHYYGCSALNYAENPKVVEKYVENLTTVFNFEDSKKMLYVDSGLHFTIPKEYYKDIYEGILPVLVTGSSVCGPVFDKPTKAFIITGNCI